MIRNLILDWSGTLADDLGAVVAATNRVLHHYDKPAFTREQFREVFQLPYTEFYRHILPDVPLADLQALYLEHFPNEDQHAVPMIEHAEGFLEFAAATGRRMFICSSAPMEHVLAQAETNGVAHYFKHYHCGIIDKCAHVHHLLRQHHLLPQETAFIGDMRHDILAGRAGGLTTIATATGYESVSTLMTADPDILVKNLSALTLLMHSPTIPA
ncbi:phosphoglycolate phosphatase [Prosthecobacter fusiformis]|uniref:phosphoglycolate phosphatase n=1 Tax=Prosthecobacter fusiformis TaxID=48464 RepID=A0A4V3FEM2_9BACT|nr:HAD hydrolase-like protein [Prosthecobacter fusiformis]TDU66513.1 phosphoglycolate phosphatase [Prosthecobacter fusiformis]